MPLINLNVATAPNTKIPNGTNAAPAAMIKALNGMGVKLAPKIAEKHCQKMIQPSV